MKLVPGTCCALVVAMGCGGPNDPFGDPYKAPGISSQRLSGTIARQPWSLGTADAALVRGDRGMQYVANLYGDTREACSSFGVRVDASLITFVVPTAPGDYDLDVEFETAAANFVSQGHVAIDSITATTISGGLKSGSGSDGINGRFDAVICP